MSPIEELKVSITNLENEIQALTTKKLQLVAKLKDQEKAQAHQDGSTSSWRMEATWKTG